MSSKPSISTDRRESSIATPKRGAGRCLVVHDDLELRLRLASLVRRAVPTLDADCIASASFDALTQERIATYVALFLIVEFGPRDNAVDLGLSRITLFDTRAHHPLQFRDGAHATAKRRVCPSSSLRGAATSATPRVPSNWEPTTIGRFTR